MLMDMAMTWMNNLRISDLYYAVFGGKSGGVMPNSCEIFMKEIHVAEYKAGNRMLPNVGQRVYIYIAHTYC